MERNVGDKLMAQADYQKIAYDIAEMPVPKYYRLKMDVISKINTGTWTDHAKLPSENELCKQYGVSRITVRKTLDELVASKYIYKIQGKGTYVAPHEQREVVLTRTTYGCSDIIRAQGCTPSHRVHFQGLTPSPANVAHALNLEEGSPVLLYVRTYYGDGKPSIYAESYINHRRLPGVENMDLSQCSFSRVVADGYNLTISNHRCTLQAVTAGEKIGTALGVESGFPLLSRKAVTEASDGAKSFPLEVSQVYYRTDSIQYIVQD